MPKQPSFQFTIDTEGDDIWSNPTEVTTKNAAYLSRFQDLCVRYAIRPTYLVNWEMAHDPVFQQFGRGILSRGEGEIGMHLHAWNSPPISAPTIPGSYLIEYPERVMREKIRVMTETLEDVFGIKLLSHRAGRWAFNDSYASLLAEFGYQIDTSVTPHISHAKELGQSGKGGSDYTAFPEHAYVIETEHGELLEIPMSIIKRRPPILKWAARKLLRKADNTMVWFRPRLRNREELLLVLNEAAQTRRAYVQMMLHSSELMPGGSPTFRTPELVERLYSCLETVFKEATGTFVGRTLSEHRHQCR